MWLLRGDKSTNLSSRFFVAAMAFKEEREATLAGPPSIGRPSIALFLRTRIRQLLSSIEPLSVLPVVNPNPVKFVI